MAEGRRMWVLGVFGIETADSEGYYYFLSTCLARILR